MGDQQPKVFRYPGYEVHTFQVNVPIGDCSIHLLITNTPRHAVEADYPAEDGPWDLPKHRQTTPLINRADSEKFRRGNVLRAILVDGGQDDEINYRGYVASKRIQKAISDIELQYCMVHETDQIAGTPRRNVAGNNQLIFDAWIVTHWDRDHYCGSLQMIHDDVRERWNDPQTLNRSSYFKYETNGKCQSTLYASSWERPSWKPTLAARKVAKKAHEAQDKPKGAPFLFPQEPLVENGISYVQMNVWGSRANCKSPLDYANENPDADRLGYARPLTGPILRLVFEIDHLIGVDFFSGRNLLEGLGAPWYRAEWANRTENIASFITQAAAKHNLKPEMPLFLCVGACGSVFGHDARAGNNIRRPTHCTVDNYQSIMAVIVWWSLPVDHNTGVVDIRLSHFMAGDAHRETEKAMINFLKLKNPNPNNMGYPIEILKAGHHGSRESTSVELLKACRPKKFIISAGRKHGHPSKWSKHSASISVADDMSNRLANSAHAGYLLQTVSELFTSLGSAFSLCSCTDI